MLVIGCDVLGGSSELYSSLVSGLQVVELCPDRLEVLDIRCVVGQQICSA